MNCIHESEPGSCDLDGEPCSKGNCESFVNKTERNEAIEEAIDKIKSMAFDKKKKSFHMCLNTFKVIDALKAMHSSGKSERLDENAGAQ